MSNENGKRWFSTGFMYGSQVGAVDAEKHVLSDAVVIRPGEAKGHDLWIDGEFCASVAAASADGKFSTAGIKARFGHPNMCGEALGTFLGRWKNLRMLDDGAIIGDLYLSSTAAESPRGDLRKYVEEMAAKEPEHFGASIVFSRDLEKEDEFMRANLGAEKYTGDPDGQKFKSPDAANVANLPHARLSELHAADLVDEPAATDGMFSGIGGAALAAQVTEWLDLHPEILTALSDAPAMAEIMARYPEQINPFLARYSANKPNVVPPAELDGNANALAESKAEIEKLSGQIAGNAAEHESLLAQLEEAKRERDDALARIAAIERGPAPLSSGSAKRDGDNLTPWQKAQLSVRKK